MRPSCYLGIYLLLTCALALPLHCAGASEVEWVTPPAYESPTGDTSLTVFDARGDARLYDASYAVLIVQGKYNSPHKSFDSVDEGATRSAELLKPVLEKLGFKVLIWRDLTEATLSPVLSQVFTTLGYVDNARLVFYYFGHTYTNGPIEEPGTRTFLVPVDAPNPAKNFRGFVKSAVPISRLFAFAKEATVRHAFFAIEACQAGTALRDIAPFHLAGATPKLNEAGWITSSSARKESRQFLTAGNQMQRVPADNTFTTLLVDALTDTNAVATQDYYVTARGVMDYVKRRLKQYAPTYELDPETATYPFQGEGDLVFGRLDGASGKKLVDVRPKISGDLMQLLVIEGQEVKVGQPIAVLAPRFVVADLGVADGAVGVSRARLEQLQVARAQLTAPSQLELAAANAEIELERAKLKAAISELQRLRLYLDATQVRASVAGTVDRILVRKGQWVIGEIDSLTPTSLIYIGTKR